MIHFFPALAHAAIRCAAGAAIAVLALVAVAPSNAGSFLDRTALEQLNGTYRSRAAENWGGAFGTREFRFADGGWSLRFVLALDPAMTQPVFEFRTRGPYRVVSPSAKVPGAFDAVFYEDAKFVTLRTSDARLVEAFGLAGCGLVPGVEKDISASGCAQWKPVALCREDHDLLALGADGALYFGVRPRDNDMCTADRRPTALLPAVFKQ